MAPCEIVGERGLNNPNFYTNKITRNVIIILMESDMLKELIYIANSLDERGFKVEADFIDGIIKKAQEGPAVNFVDGFEDKHFGETRFSTFDGTSQELAQLIKANIGNNKRSLEKEGAWLVSLPPDNFRSGVIELEPGDDLAGNYDYQLDNKELGARKVTSVRGKEKPRAKFVDAVTSNPNMPVVTVFSLIASQIQDEPMNPEAMMWNRYYWGKDSSSAQEFDERLSRAFDYWKDKAMWEPSND